MPDLKQSPGVISFLITFFICTGFSAMAHAQEYFTLSNGLQVIIEKDQRFPLVSCRLYVKAGAAHELPGEEGISHFLEHMVFKGTEKRGPGRLAREVEEAGGYINAGTSFDYTVYTIDLPSQNWRLGLDILNDMIFNSVFDPRELKQEKNVVLAEIQRARDNPDSRIFKSLQSVMFKDTPYEHPILGYEHTVQDFKAEDLKNYITRLYQPGSMVLAVSGNIEPDMVLDEVEKVFGTLHNWGVRRLPDQVKPDDQLPRQPLKRIRLEYGPWNKSYMAIAMPAPDLNSPLTPAADVLAYLLGGDKTSLLYSKLKYQKDLVHSISSSVLTLERTGLFYTYVQLNPDEMEKFWNRFMDVTTSLKADDFTQKQIQRAVVNIEESVLRSRETLGDKAASLGYNQLFIRNPQAMQNYLHNLRRVTKQDLQNIIDRYLSPESMGVSVLMPEEVKIAPDFFARAMDLSSPGHIPGQQEPEQQPKTRVVDLGQGRTLVLIEDRHLPHTAVNIAWPGGNSLVSRDLQGLPELTARTITRQTRDMDFQQIQAFLKDRGASINASAARDRFSMSARFPSEHAGDIFNLLSRMVLYPSFSEHELNKALSDQLAAIRSQEDRPLGYAFRHLFPFLFADGPYSYLQLGDARSLGRTDPETMRRYWDRQKAMPFVISVCGKLDQEAVDVLIAALDRIPVSEDAQMPVSAWSGDKNLDLSMDDRSQAHVLMIFPVPGISSPDTPSLKVLNKILSGQGG
ncbi:MAG: M16 family metallopeptidase, partial [Desulfonatronovibrionaceae bacterium]